MDYQHCSVATLLSHAAEVGAINDPHGATHMPIYQTATFDLKKQGETPYDYTRSGNPTRHSLENLFTKVCEGRSAHCTHTGLGAVALLLETLVKTGDHIVVEQDCYGGTYRLLQSYRERLDITIHFVDCTDTTAVEQVLSQNDVRFILFETPTNPGLKIIDIAAIAKRAHAHNTLCVVDNSLATFISQKPLALGADISFFSTTKYVSGHGSVVGGVLVTGRDDLVDPFAYAANAYGRSQNPMDVYVTSLGLPTLPMRMKLHEENAHALATWLETLPEVVSVTYPGLPSHPQHELARTQMRYFSGVFTVDFDTPQTAQRVVEKTVLFGEKASFGTADSRIEIPGKISHASFSEAELAAIGITPATVRLSLGLESVDDLKKDIQEALYG
ncbi:trans-sulfuration enzyme family protein [Chitinivibrio alkaliphilus]|uniref:Cystathionine gamma-synthase n=1 Tax=Chitinivibrio alkaliphilus ACht1 TaxID=1313304 RepID=U7D8V8_9BACT|nr:PLP-dependent aspartate aminotransferase family protein [Chitinivibrio alkaliphilus]ERP32021.1 cystathionine gamma-synthase [Chitinivibrio alkaliphilus ACht1]